MRREVGLSPHDCKARVEQVLDQITDCLAQGEAVKLSGLGVFTVRQKRERLGRNLKTGQRGGCFHLDPPLFSRTS